MMRALKSFEYMGRRFKPGDVFEPAADATEGLALAQMAVEIDEEDKPHRQKKKYKTRHMVADDE